MRIAIGSPGDFRQTQSIRVAEVDSTELGPEVAQSGKISHLPHSGVASNSRLLVSRLLVSRPLVSGPSV